MSLVGLVVGAICMAAPVQGPIVAGYAPVGEYGGHWGVDYRAAVGTPVMAPVAGRVTFAGVVAGMATITVEPVPGFKVSVSYLSAIEVGTGETVERGQVIGRSGMPHGIEGVHLSTRIDGRYVDPEQYLGCRQTDITRALRLLTPPGPYFRQSGYRPSRGSDLGGVMSTRIGGAVSI
jgi:murein DD-endopeptidase MepM/ murein hydrolase activator NlpD